MPSPLAATALAAPNAPGMAIAQAPSGVRWVVTAWTKASGLTCGPGRPPACCIELAIDALTGGCPCPFTNPPGK
jgi:hypothetical protein